jgi:hypothetical protein
MADAEWTDESSEEAGEYEAPRVQIALTHALVALADLDDEDLVRAHRWQAHREALTGPWYARTSIDGRFVYMHELLVKPAPGMRVHHVNGDGLDNRRSNLRVRKQEAGLP